MQNSFAVGCGGAGGRAGSKRECESAKCERACLRAAFFRRIMVPFDQQQEEDRVDCCIGRTGLDAMIGDCPRTCLIVCFLHLRWLILSLSQRVVICGWRGVLSQSDKFLKIQAATMGRTDDKQTLARFLKQSKCY